MHVHQPQSQVCKPGESLALRKVQHPHNGRTSVNRFPLTKQDILSQYSSCFEGIGHFPGDPYKFHLKPDHKPARHAPRKVPVHLETAFKEEIDSLVRQGILEEVKKHTDWVNSYVIVEKDTGNAHAPNHTVKKKLRICLDPRDLNEALEREPYHTRSVDEITAKLQGMTVFTIVDFKKGYWMVVLHPDSRELTCMALPFGRFQWTRLPMGTVVAQDIFQSKLDAIFVGMKGVTGIADDMIIAGEDEMEHDRNFLAFMEKCRSDNGPCYNSKEFQQMLQCYNIKHQTSSPHHPRSNGFVERMVGVAKKLMDKAGSEGKQWISGLYEYRVTPQSGSIALPLQLITQRTLRERDLPQLPSTLGAQEMYDTHQEILRRQPVQPERNYIELTPGMAVWVQHRQNTSWEPAIVASQSSSNSYWIMQENSSDQPKVYRRTRSMLKIRCTNIRHPTPEYSHLTENQKAKFHSPYISNEERNLVRHNSVNKVPSNLVTQTKSSTASVSDSVFSERKKEIAEIAEDAPAEEPAPAPTLETVKERPHTPGTRKSTRKNFGKPASAYSDFYI